MLSKKTTLVLGAGSSFELGLPTGDGLQDNIAQLLRTRGSRVGVENEDIWKAILESTQADGLDWSQEAPNYEKAAQKIVAGMPSAASIDNFLHTHRTDRHIVRLGKFTIAKAILDAEAKSHIKPRATIDRIGSTPPLNQQGYKESWYYPFIKMLTMGTSLDDPNKLLSNLNFIVFNYDRCLEAILSTAVKTYFGVSDHEAAEIVMKSTRIIHPYGSLGPLPTFSGSNFTPFGSSSPDIYNISSGIKTFTEAVNSDVAGEIKQIIRESDVIVFLGFGFLPQNLLLLEPATYSHTRSIHATTYGFSESDKAIIQKRLRGFINPLSPSTFARMEDSDKVDYPVFADVDNLSCRSLIENHRMRLMEN